MRNIILSSFCSFLSFYVIAQGTVLQTANAFTVNISPKRLERIDQLLKKQIDSGLINGAVGFIARDGKIVYFKAFGVDDADKIKPLKSDAIFRIASQTKAITSVAAMMLFEEGKFLLDDSVGKYIPAFANQQVIVEPLGMKDTYFYLPDSKYDRLVTAYSEHGHHQLKKWEEKDWPFFNANYPKIKGTYYSGGAGLSSTIRDYAIFLQMLLNGGRYNGHRILSKHTVDLMTSNQIGDMQIYDPPYGVNKWGLGFEITTKAGQALLGQTEGSFEWAGFWSTKFWVDPRERLVCLLFMQQFPVRWDLFDKFKVAVYQSLDD